MYNHTSPYRGVVHWRESDGRNAHVAEVAGVGAGREDLLAQRQTTGCVYESRVSELHCMDLCCGRRKHHSPRLCSTLEARPPCVCLVKRRDRVLQCHLRKLHRDALKAWLVRDEMRFIPSFLLDLHISVDFTQ